MAIAFAAAREATMDARNWPTELRLRDGGRLLTVAYPDATFDLPAEYLRVESPSAEVQGHAPSERRTVANKSAVRIRAVEPVGRYAAKLVFDDGHDSGLYTWDYLHALGAEREARWARYLGELDAQGLSRDAPAPRGGAPR